MNKQIISYSDLASFNDSCPKLKESTAKRLGVFCPDCKVPLTPQREPYTPAHFMYYACEECGITVDQDDPRQDEMRERYE